MLIITGLYLALVYLLFFKFRVLPWNKVSQGLVVLIGTIILTGFLVGLQGLTPSSVQATITGRIVEIAPLVSGRVTEVPVEANTPLEEGDVLFKIDPFLYEARIDELEASLALSRLRLQRLGWRWPKMICKTRSSAHRQTASYPDFSFSLVCVSIRPGP
jgi:multidrug resistance efflux pump